ncbi:bifunctional diguanylate cyclase/phosphodiesterase [Colwellia echini]|uniref:EAL domain-containing protein n=1 Tax=Colwellia echini TaxID=1982103 RepID=A0ABY3MZA7_9GAMM|nr:EAL domain-containing protein [Colwellia echini]TYK66542.1 EAL domain-containing protein [Colwellia echini]
MEIFYTAAMTLNLLCALVIMVSGIQKQESHFLSLALLNVLVFLFNLFSWQLHASTTLESIIQISRYQTMVTIIGLPLMTFTFGSWSKYKYTKQLTMALSIAVIPFLILNFLGDSSLRYSGETQLVQFTSVFGNTISLLSGETNPIFVGIHIIFVINSLMLAFFSYRLFRQEKNTVAIILAFLLLAQVFANYIGYKIDSLELPFFYVGGLPLTLISVVCLVLISSRYKTNIEKLKKGEQQKADIDKAISALAIEVSNTDDFQFYNKTALNIQQLFKTKFVNIGIYCEGEIERRIETLSVINNGKLMENFSYPLKNTPCDEVVGKDICIYENNVDKQFSEDEWLTNQEIKAYIGIPLFNKQKEPLGIVTLMHDTKYQLDLNLRSLLDVFANRISAELARDNLAKKLKMLAYYDYITKLPNRAHLLEQINLSFKRNAYNQTNALLILVDLDNFKEINKVYGYDFADDILKEIGHRLKIYAGENIFVARNGGDEFAIIIDQLSGDKTSLIEVNWQAISAVIKAPIRINDQEVIVECSAGNVIYPLQTDDMHSVIRYAESALQQAKYNGRNQYAVFDKNIQAVFERQQIILTEVQAAMTDNNQLHMVYQPQTDGDGNLMGAESLIRWISPEYGFISPAEFIPIVEKTELIHQLGYWIIENVFKQLQSWKTAELKTPAHISINIAAKQLIHTDFVPKLVSLCNEYQIIPSEIVLELTESGILEDKSIAIASLLSLKGHGFMIALDDFGTGYSSLSHLKDLPIDILKIDKSFIDDVFSPGTKQIIQSMFSTSKHLDLDTIAEGMETKEQVDELLHLGCTCFQGYYFSKPLPAEDFIQWRHLK